MHATGRNAGGCAMHSSSPADRPFAPRLPGTLSRRWLGWICHFPSDLLHESLPESPDRDHLVLRSIGSSRFKHNSLNADTPRVKTGDSSLKCRAGLPKLFRRLACPFCVPARVGVKASEGSDEAGDLALVLRPLRSISGEVIDGFRLVEKQLRAHDRCKAAEVVSVQIATYEVFQHVDIDEMTEQELSEYVEFMAKRVHQTFHS